jgi:hypothetical protein
LRRLPAYFFFGSVSDDIGAVLEAPELAPPLPAADPEALGELELPEPLVESEALPLMPPLAAGGAELELLLEPDAGGVTVTEPLVLELAGGVAAPGAELELLLELAGAREVSGTVLEPALDDEEVPGRVASLDFGADDGPRSQPVAASAIATAAATSVKWVSLCITVSFGWGVDTPRLAGTMAQ